MSASASFEVLAFSIMEDLTKTAVAEMTKLFDAGSAALRLEVCRSERENEELKAKLMLMERELRTVRGYGDGTPGNSVNLSFEVQVCDEFREGHGLKVAGKGRVSATESIMNEGLSSHLTRDDQNVPVEKATLDVFELKHEPVDGEQDWIAEERLCKEEEEHMQPCPAGDAENWLQAELKQEPEEQPITPTPPLLEPVDWGIELESVWSEANHLGITLQQNRKCRGSSEHGDSWLADDFPPLHYRASQRPCVENDEGPASHLEQKQNGRPLRVADDISAQTPFPLNSTAESGGSAPCEASSDTSAEVQSPCRIKEQEEEFICTRCGKTFLDALELKRHVEQHSAGKRFSCSESSKGFTSTRILEKHEQVHSREKPLTPSVYNKSFSQSHDLQEQKSTRTGQKRYVCVECGKCFTRKNTLITHQRVHTGEKPYHCNECGKRFSLKSILKTHQATHTGEKPHRCNECGRSFAQLVNLKTHERVHTGEKPFTCEHCGKCFTQKNTLTRHQRVHTGEKPYHCNECGKSFAELFNFRTHQRVHTGGETIPLLPVQQYFHPESVQHVVLL